MGEASKYKIAIAEDEALLLRGLVMLVNEHPNLEVCWTASNGIELLERIQNKEFIFPDLILCDIEMPEMDGIEASRALNEINKELKVVILSSHYHEDLILKMIEIGASAFMPKNETPEEFYLTLLNVIEKGFHYNDHVMKLILQQLHFGKKSENKVSTQLTKREIEILDLICQQLTNKEISEQLFLSVRTIEGHRNNLLMKTDSKNTAGLIIYAIENGYYKVNLKNKDWY